MEHTAPRSPVRRLGNFLQGTPSLEFAYQTFRGIFTPPEAAHLLQHYTGASPAAVAAPNGSPLLFTCPEDEVSRLEIERYMRNQLLRDSDVMSMAWGLELRVPYVDHKLVEAVTAIPAAQRLQPGKQLLLQAVPEIPEWVANQPKRGFVFPFDRWMAEEWKTAVSKTEHHAGVRLETWYQKWCLFVLERWCAAQ